MSFKPSAILYLDGYKLDHRRQYPTETSLVYSNWTPRKSRIPNVDSVVVFGIQYFIKRFLISEFNDTFFNVPEEVILEKYARRVNNYLGRAGAARIGVDHIRALHRLRYLPIKVKALPEGSRCPIKVPAATIVSTHKDFFWLVNYLETLWSCENWGPTNSATLAAQYRKIFNYWAEVSGADKGAVQFQGHDFSMRGMFGVDAAMASAAGHLLSFSGTDTVPAIDWLEEYYGADSDNSLVGVSVAATEHAVMCVGTGFYIKKNGIDWEHYGEAEYAVFERLLTQVYPDGIVSIVSDTWNLWTVLTDYLPRLKDTILAREGKIVIRPDSGDPVDIICGVPGYVVNQGTVYEVYDKEYHGGFSRESHRQSDKYTAPEVKGVVELLWDIFGGTTNDTGFKRLNEKVGCIYGDSINLERADTICRRLVQQKEFESTSWIAGIGSFTYQYNTRDTLGWAMKATYAEVELSQDNGNGVISSGPIGLEIFKKPITDDGEKTSAKGLLQVISETDHDNPIDPVYKLRDQVSWKEEGESHLTTVFEDGRLVRETTLAEIRQRLWN
jgi:nicotinamide phosphoribosyltransferase